MSDVHKDIHACRRFGRWDDVMEGTSPLVQWFTGGQLTASHNCLDHREMAETRSGQE